MRGGDGRESKSVEDRLSVDEKSDMEEGGVGKCEGEEEGEEEEDEGGGVVNWPSKGAGKRNGGRERRNWVGDARRLKRALGRGRGGGEGERRRRGESRGGREAGGRERGRGGGREGRPHGL